MELPPGCVDECPGCSHRYLSDTESLAQKQTWLCRTLAPWSAQIHPITSLGEYYRYNYRDRVTLSAQWSRMRWSIGLRRGDDVVSIPDCPVHSPRVRAVVRTLLELLPDGNILPLAYLLVAGAQVTLVIKDREVETGS